MNETQTLAFGLLEQLRELLRTQHRMFFDIGKLLTELKDEELYKNLGDGGYQTWGSFLGSNELGISKTTAQAYMTLYDFWIVQKRYTLEQLSEVPYDKLRMVLPTAREATSDEEVSELFHKAKELSRTDLQIEIGKADEDGRLKVKIVGLSLCDKCKGYKLPEDLVICDC